MWGSAFFRLRFLCASHCYMYQLCQYSIHRYCSCIAADYERTFTPDRWILTKFNMATWATRGIMLPNMHCDASSQYFRFLQQKNDLFSENWYQISLKNVINNCTIWTTTFMTFTTTFGDLKWRHVKIWGIFIFPMMQQLSLPEIFLFSDFIETVRMDYQQGESRQNSILLYIDFRRQNSLIPKFEPNNSVVFFKNV